MIALTSQLMTGYRAELASFIMMAMCIFLVYMHVWQIAYQNIKQQAAQAAWYTMVLAFSVILFAKEAQVVSPLILY